MKHHVVIIVGAGPAGIGTGAILKRMGIDFVILERDSVGSSFKKWPEEMQLISPSFTGNFFGSVDLNAVTPDTSPAYSLQTEHPSGKDYAKYLESVSDFYELPVETGYDITSVTKERGKFTLETNRGHVTCDYLIWAAGEFQYPNLAPFSGAENCIHNTTVGSWKDLTGEEFVVIGGYESGIDAAYQLAKLGKKVTVIDSGDQLANLQSDSSYALSPFTRDRYNEQKENITLVSDAKVSAVEKTDNGYALHIDGQETLLSPTQPILATGFDSSLRMINDLFSETDGDIDLTEHDESLKIPGLFLVGPQVKHGGAIFCFIYKYRQRFPVVAEEIAERLGVTGDALDVISEYKLNNFYMNDLGRCGDECAC